jgi:hypothetical protein
MKDSKYFLLVFLTAKTTIDIVIINTFSQIGDRALDEFLLSASAIAPLLNQTLVPTNR